MALRSFNGLQLFAIKHFTSFGRKLLLFGQKFSIGCTCGTFSEFSSFGTYSLFNFKFFYSDQRILCVVCRRQIKPEHDFFVLLPLIAVNREIGAFQPSFDDGLLTCCGFRCGFFGFAVDSHLCEVLFGSPVMN
jgi:hypothetical protein